MSRTTKGTIIAIVGITFWSVTGVLISYLITNFEIPALLLAFWRDLFVCVALVPALFLIRRSSASHQGISNQVFRFLRPDFSRI